MEPLEGIEGMMLSIVVVGATTSSFTATCCDIGVGAPETALLVAVVHTSETFAASCAQFCEGVGMHALKAGRQMRISARNRSCERATSSVVVDMSSCREFSSSVCKNQQQQETRKKGGGEAEVESGNGFRSHFLSTHTTDNTIVSSLLSTMETGVRPQKQALGMRTERTERQRDRGGGGGS